MQCPKFKQQSAITSKRYEIGYQLPLITSRKSHTVFWSVPTSVTLNDLEWHNSPYFALFHLIRSLCRPIMSQWLKSHPAVRSLYDSWATYLFKPLELTMIISVLFSQYQML